MSDTPPCPCDAPSGPRIISNPPGRDSVDYRTGDYASVRRALLRPLDGEIALAGWHPEPGGDLALQLLEWWAYLADILTFYNERAMQEVLLRTAALPEDVRRIVRLLGYRPRPGIGATGVVAALTNSPRPFVLPAGFGLQSEAAPDSPAQIFELENDVQIGRLGTALPASARFPTLTGSGGQWVGPSPKGSGGKLLDSLPAIAPVDPKLYVKAGQSFTLALDGAVTSLKPDDIILIVKRDWQGAFFDPLGYSMAMVTSAEPIFDENGHVITQLTLIAGASLPDDAERPDYQYLRATKQAHLWLYHERYPGSSNPSLIAASTVLGVVESIFDPGGLFSGGASTTPPQDPRVITGLQALSVPPPHGVAHLEAVTRGINPGDPVLFEKRFGGGLMGMFDQLVRQTLPAAALAPLRLLIMQLVKVTGYAEDIWYGNAPQMDHIGTGPPVGPPSHGIISGGEGPIPLPHSRITFDPNPFLDMMAGGDHDIGTIVIHYSWQEVGQVVDPHSTDPTQAVAVPAAPGVPADAPVPVLVEDATGNGTHAWLGQSNIPVDGEPLVPPLRALLNLLPVSRGQSIAGEVLGSGDPTFIGQEFALQRSPLTYLGDTGPRSINGYRSTLRVRVDGIEWREVPSFYGQPAGARVFVTREDEAQKTYVRFGDGENGARLPAGTDNVIADYRIGSGAALPRPGTLTTILTPQPGLQSIVNPVPVGGGADPDPPDQIRRYAPRSVLTFGRAISGDDYEVVAAQTPGVLRARAYWGWDAPSQRSVVKVFVGDDDAAVAAARAALLAFGDPNRPVVVAQATPLYPDLSLTLEVDPARDPDAVMAAVRAALLAPGAQPFGTDVVRIGQIVYDSQIYDACLQVPGVVAVHGLQFGLWIPLPSVVVAPSLRLMRRPILPDPPDTNASVNFTTPPNVPGASAFEELLGPRFLPSELYDPDTLARRLHVEQRELFDPFALALRLAPHVDPGDVDPPPPPPPGPTEVLQLESAERHSPGEGGFYLMREDRLHIVTELARHGL